MEASVGVLFQPTEALSTSLDISYSDFFRDDDGGKVYDVKIIRNRTVLQLNKSLFIRAVTEYNTFRKRIDANILVSFTHIPGTVMYLGYGSVYEKVNRQNQATMPADNFLQTGKSIFFKASYLFRL